jgi:hypothetical protein
VQNADSAHLLDDPDAALQGGSSDKTRGHAAACLLRFERLKLKTDFDKLSKPNARRLLRFWQVGEVSARSP